MELDVATFDVPAALSNALTLVRERAQRHGIALGLQRRSAVGEIRADERKFKQILLNLLSNAVKFTPEGGRVDVRARRADDGRLEVAVADTGIGIAPERPAGRVRGVPPGRPPTTRASSEGTGLGLALTRAFRRAARRDDLRLTASRARARRSPFTLPGAAMSMKTDPDRRRQREEHGAGARHPAGQGLRDAGGRNGEDGVRLALAASPDLILMDIQLPGMNGIEALRRIRARRRHRADTGGGHHCLGHAPRPQQNLGAGFDGFLGKPINLKEFRTCGACWARARQSAPGRSSADPEARSAQGRSVSAHILVVDDTPANVKLLVDVLAAKGYRLSAAASGEEAVARIAEQMPDLVLLDIMMPGLSGYDVCRRIRANPATALLPVVLCTSLDPKQERINGIEAGADDFLPKPINQAELFARVRSLLRIKTLQDEVKSQAAQLAEWNRTLEERVPSRWRRSSAWVG